MYSSYLFLVIILCKGVVGKKCHYCKKEDIFLHIVVLVLRSYLKYRYDIDFLSKITIIFTHDVVGLFLNFNVVVPYQYKEVTVVLNYCRLKEHIALYHEAKTHYQIL